LKKYIFILLALAAFQHRDEIDKYLNPPPDYTQLAEDEVILYATDWCGYCEKARVFMDEQNIPYTEYDIEKSYQGKQQYKSLGGTGAVPLLQVKGEVVRGYHPEKIIWHLNQG